MAKKDGSQCSHLEGVFLIVDTERVLLNDDPASNQSHAIGTLLNPYAALVQAGTRESLPEASDTALWT